MSLDKIKLPLWALRQADACFPGERVADFAAHHGHPPGDDSTLAEWWWVITSPEDRIWYMGYALPLVYPDRAQDLHRAAGEVAYLAARRVWCITTADPATGRALVLIRRWLADGGVDAESLHAAAIAVGNVAYWAINAAEARERADAADWAKAIAADAVGAAAWAAYAGAAAHDDPAGYAYNAVRVAAQYALMRDSARRARTPAFDVERAQQRADLDRLLAELNLGAA